MNGKFFTLPEEKQKRIINAAYVVFAGSSYQKASMSRIAAAGGISDNDKEAGQEAINRNYDKAVQRSYQFVSEIRVVRSVCSWRGLPPGSSVLHSPQHDKVSAACKVSF